MNDQTATNMDGGWKQIIEDYLEEFFRFFFPDIHALINFEAGYTLSGSTGFQRPEFSRLANRPLQPVRKRGSGYQERNEDTRVLGQGASRPLCGPRPTEFVCLRLAIGSGDEGWVELIARRLNLESTLRPRGRKRIRFPKEAGPL